MRHFLSFAIASASAFSLAGEASAQPVINASVLPNARSVQENTVVTWFAAIQNSGDATATNCFMSFPGDSIFPGVLSYQTTDINNQLTGAPNTPVDIPAGSTQNFLASTTAVDTFASTDWEIDYVCDGALQAPVLPGVNTMRLAASATPTPDILSISATLTADGAVRVVQGDGNEPFTISALNIGVGDIPPAPGQPAAPMANEATITVRPTPQSVLNGAQFGARLDICETNALGQCITGRAESVTTTIGDAPAFFKIRAVRRAGSDAGIPFFPDFLRVTVEFLDSGGDIRGATSVAVEVEGPNINTETDQLPVGLWYAKIGEEVQGDFFLVTPNGEVWGETWDEVDPGDEPIARIVGTISADNTATPDARLNMNGSVVTGGDVYPMTAGGRWGVREFLRGNLRLTVPDAADPSFDHPAATETVPYKGVYTLETERPMTLAGLANVYDVQSLPGGGEAPGPDYGDLTLTSLGAMSGTVSNASIGSCAVSGQMTQFDALNLFDVTMTLSGVGCNVAGSYQGAALWRDIEDGDDYDGIGLIFADVDLQGGDVTASFIEFLLLTPQ